MSRKLYVGNLSYNTTEGELETLFSQSGTVESVRVMRDMGRILLGLTLIFAQIACPPGSKARC